LGVYAVFFNESFPLQDPGDRPVRRERGLKLLEGPLDGGYPDLGIGLGLQMLPGGNDEILLLLAYLRRPSSGSPALIFVPVGISRLVPLEPFINQSIIAIRDPLECQFCGPPSGQVGHYGPEAVVEGLSARSGARAQVGSRGLSRD